MLEAYKKANNLEHGKVMVPQSYRAEPNGFSLGIWFKQQMQAKNGTGNSKLSASQIERMNELGVQWAKPRAKRSENMVEREREPIKRPSDETLEPPPAKQKKP